MASGVNRVILVANLGKDPEVRFSRSGQAICTLRVAVSERKKDGDGWRDHTEWMDVVTFGKTAENAGEYLQKGRQIYVEGRLRTTTYKDKEGKDRWRTEVVAEQVLFLGGGKDAAQTKQDAPQTPPAGEPGSAPGQAADEDFLPF